MERMHIFQPAQEQEKKRKNLWQQLKRFLKVVFTLLIVLVALSFTQVEGGWKAVVVCLMIWGIYMANKKGEGTNLKIVK